MRLVVVRNDKLGDFMLAWPALALLRGSLPDATLAVLVPAYTAPIAALCPYIDEVVIDPRKTGIIGTLALARLLRQGRFDAMVTLFSTSRVALAGCLARIPYRLAPATKLAQFCYRRRLVQRRSRSERPEYAYNIELAWQMLEDLGIRQAPSRRPEPSDGDWLPGELQRPLLMPPTSATRERRTEFCRQHGLPPAAQLIFIHPGSGGSATNLMPSQYAQLASGLRSVRPLAFVITAGPGEETIAKELAAALTPLPVTVLGPDGGLPTLVDHLALADLFISGSTGPMHIAGALDRPTATFYPRHRSATPLRWQPLNAPTKRLAFTPPECAQADAVGAIDIGAASRAINRHFLGSDS